MWNSPCRRTGNTSRIQSIAGDILGADVSQFALTYLDAKYRGKILERDPGETNNGASTLLFFLLVKHSNKLKLELLLEDSESIVVSLLNSNTAALFTFFNSLILEEENVASSL